MSRNSKEIDALLVSLLESAVCDAQRSGSRTLTRMLRGRLAKARSAASAGGNSLYTFGVRNAQDTELCASLVSVRSGNYGTTRARAGIGS